MMKGLRMAALAMILTGAGCSGEYSGGPTTGDGDSGSDGAGGGTTPRSMEGFYGFEREDGEPMEVRIPFFPLAAPATAN